jgi:hypothetical protein
VGDGALAEPLKVANMPVGGPRMPGGEAEVDAMIERLERRVSQAPNDVQSQWRLALLRLAFGEETRIDEISSEMLEDSAVLLRGAVRAISATWRATEDPVRGMDEALAAVEALRMEVRQRAGPEIPTIALCSRVQAFGAYDVLPDGALRPNAQNQAIVYFEVKNFKSEPSADGRWRTLLSGRLEVLTSGGELMWEQPETSIEDLCSRRREDFFVAQRIVLQAPLPEGPYVLKVTVEDLLADKRTQAIHHFNVGPGPIAAISP